MTGTTAHGKATAVVSVIISAEIHSHGFRGVIVGQKGKENL